MLNYLRRLCSYICFYFKYETKQKLSIYILLNSKEQFEIKSHKMTITGRITSTSPHLTLSPLPPKTKNDFNFDFNFGCGSNTLVI